MKNSYFELLDKRQFPYGSKTIVLTIHIETLYPMIISDDSKIYSQHIDENQQNYYRVVTAYVFDDKEKIPETIESVSMKQKHPKTDISYTKSDKDSLRSSTFCRIRKDRTTKSSGILKYSPAYWFHRILGEKEPHLEYLSDGPAVDLLEQLEKTLQPIIEDLRFQEELSKTSVDITVDVAVDELERTEKADSKQLAEEVVSENLGQGDTEASW